MNDNYTALSGGSIYGGMLAPVPPPAWSQGIAVNQWVQVPMAKKLSDINPENNPAINTLHPNISPWIGNTGQSSVISAYCGACYDDATGEFSLPLGGGHQDYGGNEPYSVNVFAAQLTWRMLRNPSGSVGNVINLKDGQETTGFYSDGRLRAIHSYSYPCAANGKVYIGALIGQYPQGQSGKSWCYELNMTTGEHELVCDYGALGGVGISSGYGSATIDPTRNIMFLTGGGTSQIVKLDLTTKTASYLTSPDNLFPHYTTGVYAAGPDRVIFVNRQSSNNAWKAKRGITVINPATGSISYPDCEDFPSFLGGAVGAVWNKNRLLLWDNATQTNKVAVLTPNNLSDLSQPWTVSEIVGTGVTPTARTGAGTYNRLQYSERLGGILLINGTNENFYFMRTE